MEQDAEREEISQPGESDQDGSEWKEIPLSRARVRRGIEGKFPRPVDDSGAGCGTAGNLAVCFYPVCEFLNHCFCDMSWTVVI